MNAYSFHPGASLDLDDIWDFIADDSCDAADRVVDAILKRLDALASFPQQ